MRIQGPRNIDIARSDAQERSEKKTDKSEARGSESAVVRLGDSAKQLATSGAGRVSPEIRARLDEVREQLKSNSYAIDFRKLASNILSDDVARAGGGE